MPLEPNDPHLFYYGTDRSNRRGPVSQAELKSLAASGQITPSDRVWQGDSLKSAQASNVRGLFSAEVLAELAKPADAQPSSASSAQASGLVDMPIEDAQLIIDAAVQAAPMRIDPPHTKEPSMQAPPPVATPTQVPAQAAASSSTASSSAVSSSAVSSSASTAGSALVDVRPQIPRLKDGLFARIEEARDKLHELASEQLTVRGLSGHVLRSNPLEHPCWIKIEVWQPVDRDPLLTERASALIRIDAKPYHRFECEYTVEFDCRGRKKTTAGLSSFGKEEISRSVAYILGDAPRPSFAHLRLRVFPWELWRPRNKPDALAKDWVGMAPMAPLMLGLLTFTSAVVFGMLCFIVAGVGFFLVTQRKKVVRTSGKPMGEPRFLFCLDSWQTVVFGAGASWELVKSRLLARLQSKFSEQMRVRQEKIWYWSLDGISEREQIVLTLSRAIAFVHIERYGDDMYIAWDGHLNRGQWVENDLYQGIDKRSGRLAVIRVVVQGQQRLTEYDLNDANGLMEFVHAQVVQVIKQILEEQKIEQEIDFKVIRGERQNVTSAGGSVTDTVGSFARKAKNLLRIG